MSCLTVSAHRTQCKKIFWVLAALTLQYSLMGRSLFMATSLMWLLLKRIFPVVEKGKKGQIRLNKLLSYTFSIKGLPRKPSQ